VTYLAYASHAGAEAGSVAAACASGVDSGTARTGKLAPPRASTTDIELREKRKTDSNVIVIGKTLRTLTGICSGSIGILILKIRIPVIL
jgi:hypothetical protein